MKILQKYICREFLKILFFTLSAFVLIYLIVDFFARMDTFIEEKAPSTLLPNFSPRNPDGHPSRAGAPLEE
jgi:lipopolysaccharide export LptBFGC system permease protein LptF